MFRRTAAARRGAMLRLFVGCALLAGTGSVHAQVSRQSGRILHEVMTTEAPRDEAGPLGVEGGVPSLSLEPSGGEPIWGSDGYLDRVDDSQLPGPSTPSAAERTLDARTERVDQLGYHTVFEPHVAPLKRLVAMESLRMREDGRVAIANAGDRKLPVRVDSEGRGEVFWGSYLIRSQPGQWQPIASVSPKQRILTIASEPKAEIEIARDDADNFYLRSNREGLLRLNLQIAAPTFYFSGEFTEQDWSAFRPLPDASDDIDRLVDRTLDVVGVTRRGPPREVMNRLVEFFRDFRPGTMDEVGGSETLYSTLVRRQLGVCRHRALAFVITARSLGFRARWVSNEAHAFVEVYWPSQGWRRIDLGGAADRMDFRYRGSNISHQAGEDPLPQPPNYREELRRSMDGGHGSEPSESEALSTAASANPSAAGEQSSAQTEDGAGEVAPEMDGEVVRGSDAEPSESSSADIAGGEERDPFSIDPSLLPAALSEAEGEQESRFPAAGTSLPKTSRKSAMLTLAPDDKVTQRGASLRVVLELRDEDGTPIQDGDVGVYLASFGSRDLERSVEMCRGRTDRRGRVVLACAVPETQEMGRWNVFGYFAGDGRHQPAFAE